MKNSFQFLLKIKFENKYNINAIFSLLDLKFEHFENFENLKTPFKWNSKFSHILKTVSSIVVAETENFEKYWIFCLAKMRLLI